ncbi:MAG: hypothetical protein WCE62_11335 [Polyangiales bacterium]
MPVFSSSSIASRTCALLVLGLPALLGSSLLAGCHRGKDTCPTSTLTVDPAEIPAGSSEASVTVTVKNPNAGNGLPVITELTASAGTFADPFARETTYTCPHDVSGEVEICANTIYEGGGPGQDAGVPSGVGVSQQYLGPPHVRLRDPLECFETDCTTVTCPTEKNECPVVSLAVEPQVVPEAGTATITVTASDPDENPQTLVTTLLTDHGTIADPNAQETTYTCDPDVGGVIEICVIASDGDASCDVEQCTTVVCPGDPLDNTCPTIGSFTATPMVIPTGQSTTNVSVDATDPDAFPDPLRTVLSSATGVYADRYASETTFSCGAPGPVDLCVVASDGDPECDKTRCIKVQCPSDIPANLCPQLFVLNAIPSVIRPGNTSTMVQSRGQDTDGLPFPLTLTMSALWGTIENDENIQQALNVVAQDATYISDRPGPVEICVDATDGACVKTLCTDVTCPADLPTPP